MMKSKSVWLSMLFVWSILGVKAHDVYVYTTGNYTPVATVGGVSSIIFEKSNLKIRTADGSTTSVPYELFNYFRFYQTPIPLSVKSATVGEAGIDYDGNQVKIALQRQIDRVEVISTTGAVEKTYKPQASSFSFDLSGMQGGVYLVKVVSAEKNYIKKIVKK